MAHPPPDDDIELAAADPEETLVPWDPWEDAGLQVALFGAEPAPPLPVLAADTMLDMLGHGSDETSREVGGILLGGFGQATRGPLTRVQDIVIADTNQASLTHVTFTHESWAQIHAALDRRDDGLRIVGWYHTHPGFGPFLSAHDMFIHENFFTGPLQVALVLDPVQRLFAVFGWSEGQVRRCEGCYLYDEASRQEELRNLVGSLKYAPDRSAPRKGLRKWFMRR